MPTRTTPPDVADAVRRRHRHARTHRILKPLPTLRARDAIATAIEAAVTILNLVTDMTDYDEMAYILKHGD